MTMRHGNAMEVTLTLQWGIGFQRMQNGNIQHDMMTEGFTHGEMRSLPAIDAISITVGVVQSL
jgi:hypothetical protein